MIVLKNVSKNYGRGNVLDGVSLTISPGEFVCVVGPSGAGKSTLLSLLVGAESATSGSISVDGVDLRTVPAGALQVFRRRIGIVFQDYKLLLGRTVAENVAFPLEVCGMDDEAIENRVRALLQTMGLAARGDALPRELSGGEKARTAIARAIAHKPLILLADEPTQNLDPAQTRDVLQIFRDINAEGATVVLATHDPAIMSALRARVITISKGKVVSDAAEEAARSAPERDAAQHVRARRESARKVRVTAIHSD